jgi:hypothetical protein
MCSSLQPSAGLERGKLPFSRCMPHLAERRSYPVGVFFRGGQGRHFMLAEAFIDPAN